MHRVLITFVLALGLTSRAASEDWNRFRGPNGLGVTDAKNLPERWSDSSGIAWKVRLPGSGTSSPIVAGQRTFVTAYSGYGTDRSEVGELKDLRQHVVCVDARAGKILWDRQLTPKNGVTLYKGIGLPNHGYASSTPVTDGKAVYAFFGRSGVFAFDLEGKPLWKATVAKNPRSHDFGTASSLVLFEKLVIVPAAVECEAVVAFDRATGDEVWRAEAEGYGAWWSTPVFAPGASGKDLVCNVPDEMWGLNPATGKLRWHAETFSARSVSPSPVVHDGVIYAIAGRRGGSIALRAGGKRDITKSHVVWRGESGSYVPSPVVVGGHVYWVDDRGIAKCVDAKTGEEVYRERIEEAGLVYASVVAGDGKLFCVSRRGGTFVLDAKPKFRVVARNVIASDESQFNASPAVIGDRLLLRSDRFLYAIGK